MKILKYEKLPVYAVDIRNEVFVKEQGFKEEFDSDDKHAIHFVGFLDNFSASTCRVLKKNNEDYLIGRVATRKKYRYLGLGSEIIKYAENEIVNMGGKRIYIHSQIQALPFYTKLGYQPIGNEDEEEGCPHQMLFKDL